MAKTHKKETKRRLLFRYLLMLFGALLAAAAIELFLVPNSIIDGGIIGIALILNYLTEIPFSILIILINLPFLYFGYKHIGRTFFVSSIFAIVALAVFESLLHSVEPVMLDPLLATVFGGLLLGAGVGIVIRNGGALDGTEILGLLLMKKIPFTVGEFVMFFNVFVFSWAGFVLGWEEAMYSIITYFIAYKTIDTVIQGLDETKAVIIVSDEYVELAAAINERLGRSVTRLQGKGGYTKNEKDVIYVVITRLEISKLRQIVVDIDRSALMTVMAAQETHGGNFKAQIH